MNNEIGNNFFKIIDLYQKITINLYQKRDIDSDPFNISKAISEIFQKLYQNPDKLVDLQLSYFKNYLIFLENVENNSFENNVNSIIHDKRFKDPAWNNIYFDFIKNIYLMNSEYLKKFYAEIDNNQKTNFIIKQFIDAVSPSNFALTNPIVIKEIIETKGQNLVTGLEKFLEDLEKSAKFIDITTVNEQAFEVGKNLAITKGKVIYQNRLIQLIMYDNPNQNNKSYENPLLIIPPWINKYYILDLRQENSYVKWLIENNFTVFMISWINPDESYKNVDFEDYMHEGIIESINVIKSVTKQKKINTVGYCLGGTLLTITLAYLNELGDQTIKSATLLTTLIDFSLAGELSLFAEEEQLSIIESKMKKHGYLSGEDMSFTFKILQANDMIWGFFVDNYLLGKNAGEFDLLYWNSDYTRLPEKMHSFYLRNMYQKNLLIKPNGLKMKDINIDVSKIKIPCYFLSTEKDHIAPWQATYSSLHKFNNKVFVLTASGHVAGVVNHPNFNKYYYWTNNDINISSEKWLDGAVKNHGSWWDHWLSWLKKQSGKKILFSNLDIESIEDAPGNYVKIK